MNPHQREYYFTVKAGFIRLYRAAFSIFIIGYKVFIPSSDRYTSGILFALKTSIHEAMTENNMY